MAAPVEKEMIWVSKEEYDELRKLKEDLPTLLKNARNKYDDPEKHRERSKKHYENTRFADEYGQCTRIQSYKLRS